MVRQLLLALIPIVVQASGALAQPFEKVPLKQEVREKVLLLPRILKRLVTQVVAPRLKVPLVQ